MTFAIAMLLKPFFAVLIFFGTYVISRLIAPLIPDGRWKTLLYDRELRTRHPWKFCIALFVFFYGAIGLVALYVYWR